MARALQRNNPGIASTRHWFLEAWLTLSSCFAMAGRDDEFHVPTDFCFETDDPDYLQHHYNTKYESIDSQFFHYLVVPFIKEKETEEAQLEEAA
jgi:hypothetical protein